MQTLMTSELNCPQTTAKGATFNCHLMYCTNPYDEIKVFAQKSFNLSLRVQMLISFRRVPHLSHKSEIIRFISDFCVAQGPKGPQHIFFLGLIF